MEQALENEELNQEIIEHLMHPKNYGKLDEPSGVGVGHDEKTGEYVVFYIQTEDENIQEVSYATNGCQDTVVLGSMFTEMIKGDSIENGKNAVEKMDKRLSGMTVQQQVCAEMVLTSFIASLINRENRLKGKSEEMHVIKMKESCEVEEVETKEKENNDK
ncbi:MAG: iron-sulfur cluster assembly scaffold protein [Epsilonproteobacteria bacterium]|nr:MAG: iron-sulfur cluster assembly scaffold protein [Campylobacterota bacterium]